MVIFENLIEMEDSKNGGTPKSSTFIGCSIINHPFWGSPINGTPPFVEFCCPDAR